jgi:uncharacterized protein (DUF1697 family)
MNIYLALLRGINVGGRNSLPMKDLVQVFDLMGFLQITTHIQSGNVIFKSKTKCSTATAKAIGCDILKSHGFEPKVLILSLPELSKAVGNNPFASAEGNKVHFYFLDGKPVQTGLGKLRELKSSAEDFVLKDNVFYLLAPDGIGRSKMAAAVEKNLGVPVTARNLNTVNALTSKTKSLVE